MKASQLAQGEQRELSALMPREEVKSEEEVVDISVTASSLNLAEDARAASSLLKSTMFPINSVHNVYFKTLGEDHWFAHTESISESVYFVPAYLLTT